MWLHPPFFSIEVPHLGHDFVFDTSRGLAETRREVEDLVGVLKIRARRRAATAPRAEEIQNK